MIAISRLYITNKEISFINDLTKEFFGDVVGQYIILYPISTMKTNVHPIYDEAIEKIFENPIKLVVLAGQPDWESKYNMFGNEQTNKMEIYVQARYLLDNNIEVEEGDFFVYNDNVFEILSAVKINNIFGQAEYGVGLKIDAKIARKGQIDLNYLKQRIVDDHPEFIKSHTEKVFEQTRGLPTTELEGSTNDSRQLRERLKNDMAEIALGDGPRKISPTEDEKTNTFDHDSYYKIYEE